MKKLLRYLVNTILFIVIYLVIYDLYIDTYWYFAFKKEIVGPRPSGLVVIGNLIALIISFPLVKRINKSKLWSKLFDDEVVNEIVENKTDIVDENQNKKSNNISELADDLIKLNELKEKGIISEEEFTTQKKIILSNGK